jgi:hypothetical protein
MLVTLPTGILGGDIGIITFLTPSGYNPSSAGWTLIKYSGSAEEVCVLWKVMAATDSGKKVTFSSAGPSSTGVPLSIEVWGGAKPPTATFALSTAGLIPSAAAPKSSVPLYVWAGYDLSGSVGAPASLTPPSGWTGGYQVVSSYGLGLWYTAALAGTTAPGGTVTGTNPTYNGITATIILAPDGGCILAGTNATQDQVMQLVLAGSQAALDTTLVYTP